jgi:hypothetical protein
MLISILIPVIYYRISTSCQVLHLCVVYVISAIFLNHQKFDVCLHVLYYFFHDSYILTVFMIFQIANSATRTLMFFTVRRETERTDRTPDKCSQHRKECIRPTNIVSREANRERSRNTRQVFTVTT